MWHLSACSKCVLPQLKTKVRVYWRSDYTVKLACSYCYLKRQTCQHVHVHGSYTCIHMRLEGARQSEKQILRCPFRLIQSVLFWYWPLMYSNTLHFSIGCYEIRGSLGMVEQAKNIVWQQQKAGGRWVIDHKVITCTLYMYMFNHFPYSPWAMWSSNSSDPLGAMVLWACEGGCSVHGDILDQQERLNAHLVVTVTLFPFQCHLCTILKDFLCCQGTSKDS